MTFHRVLRLVLVALCLTSARALYAQTPTVSWAQGNVSTAAQAQAFTYRLRTTPSGSTVQGSATALTSVTCTGSGTAPITVACSAPLPSANAGATVTGASTTITSQDTADNLPESPQSAPFVAGSAVPTGLKIQ